MNTVLIAIMMKRAELVRLVGLGYSTIYRMEKAGMFPARKQLSAGRVAWRRDEVEAWIDSRVSLLALA